MNRKQLTQNFLKPTGTGMLAVVLMMVACGAALADTAIFQQGANGYAGNVDAQLRQAAPDWDSSTNFYIYVYSTFHGLTRFNDLFGAGLNQIPVGSTITGATLRFTQFDDPAPDGLIDVHRMIADWTGTDTWNSMVNGIQRDNAEAMTAATVTGGGASFDVTADVQAFASGTPNRGWSLHLNASSPSNWYVYAAHWPTIPSRPMLIVDFDPPAVATEYSTWGSTKAMFR